MRILVTGASGFVGAAVVRAAVARGHDVAIVRRPGSSPARLAGLDDVIRCVDLGEASVDAAARVIDAAQPDAVVHAGWHGVRGDARQELEQVTTNVPFAIQLAAAARAAECRAFLGFGSQAEYGPQDHQLAEDAPARPVTLYGAAKLATGMSIGAVLAQSPTRFAWLRIFSSYGPGDNPWVLLSYCIRTLLDGGRPALTPCTQRWDFVFIDDVARATLDVLECETASGNFNVGSGVAVTLRHVLEQLRDLIDPALPLGFGERPYAPGQIMLLHADVGRLRRVTGWRPEVALDEGLRRTVTAERRRAGTDVSLPIRPSAR